MKRILNKTGILVFVSLLGVISGMSQIPKIGINPKSRPKGNLMLSDLVQSVEYIPLETNENCLVGAISFFSVTDNYIAVYCHKTTQVYLFTYQGRFVAKIGREGEGPGEYLKYSMQNIFLDEKNNQIFIHASYPSRLMYYNLKGEYIKSEAINE